MSIDLNHLIDALETDGASAEDVGKACLAARKSARKAQTSAPATPHDEVTLESINSSMTKEQGNKVLAHIRELAKG